MTMVVTVKSNITGGERPAFEQLRFIKEIRFVTPDEMKCTNEDGLQYFVKVSNLFRIEVENES